MNETDDQNPLLWEIVHNAMPPGVVADIPIDAPGFMADDFFPAPVVDQIIANWNQPPPPPPNTQTDGFMMYKDPVVERMFLKWEAERTRWWLGLSSLFLFCCFVAHLSVCGRELDWNCGDSKAFTLATVLIWLPVTTLLLPDPYNWQYKEMVCVLHQLVFGGLMHIYLWLNFKSLDGYPRPDLVLYCTVPILIETVLFKVRLRYHYPLNALLIALSVSPWFLSETIELSYSDYVVNIAATVIIPACFVSLYQARMRKTFEETL